jgi:general secretion pathway protein A
MLKNNLRVKVIQYPLTQTLENGKLKKCPVVLKNDLRSTEMNAEIKELNNSLESSSSNNTTQTIAVESPTAESSAKPITEISTPENTTSAEETNTPADSGSISEKDPAAETAESKPNAIDEFSYLYLSSEKEKESKSIQRKIDIKPTESLSFLEFFNFKENPFGDSVNTNYFYKTTQHYNVFQKMKMSAEQNISLGLVSGQSGVGKTMITQMLLTNLDPQKFKTIVVLVSPGMTKTALIKDILLELGVEEGQIKTQQSYDLLRLLHDKVIELYQTGKRLVIIIDEAHFLESSSLHVLRTISNIELPEMKLTTCLLFAESIFQRRLKHESYNSLRSRMYTKEDLQPFALEETTQYIKHRLAVAGREDEVFMPETFEVIQTATGGIAREVNNLAYNAMVEAYLAKEEKVSNELLLNCL